MYQYCAFGLWEDLSLAQEKMDEIQRKIFRLHDDENIEEALKKAEAWLEQSRKLLDDIRSIGMVLPAQMNMAEQLGGPLLEEARRYKYLDLEEDIDEVSDVPTMENNDSSHRQIQNHGQSTGKAHKSRSIPYQRMILQKQAAIRQHVKHIKIAPVALREIEMGTVLSSPLGKLLGKRGTQKIHPNFICALTPEPQWNLYIDESGQNFHSNGDGLIAGVLCSAANPLPKQPKLHGADSFSEEDFQAEDKVLETLLHYPQTGILAVATKAYHAATGWGSQVASLIGLVLRMLPMPAEGMTNVNVYVENCGGYALSQDFRFLEDGCRYSLQEVFPERASRITLHIAVMDKLDPRNAYADLVAHTCYARNELSKKRLKITQWSGACWLKAASQEVQKPLDYFYGGRNLDAEAWDGLVVGSAESSSGLLGALAQAYGAEAQQNVKVWRQYLDWTVQHLVSKAVNLGKLRAQLNWLHTFQPRSEQLPPRLKLLWLIARLAEANHLGKIENEASEDAQEFRRLARCLRDEDAPLVCWAYLQLAEAKTNAFQFAEAKALLQEYLDIYLPAESVPVARVVAIPGLRHYGQLLSSLGQYEAFLGNLEKSIGYFREAISRFECLSEDKEGEIDMTRAFLATVQMDLAPEAPETIEAMERYLETKLEQAAQMLASSTDDKLKYHHHIFLRYLAHAHDANKLWNRYFERCRKWGCGAGHPWEMIEFYRALLLPEGPERLQRLENAYQIALEGGPTLLVIATVILAATLYFTADDGERHKEYMRHIDDLAKLLPALGEQRFQALRRQANNPIPPLELAKIVLPFNFR